MNCPYAKSTFNPLASDPAHLAICSDCRQAWPEDALLADLLRARARESQALSVPPHFINRLRARLEAESNGARRPIIIARSAWEEIISLPTRWAYALGAAVAVILLASLFLPTPERVGPVRLASADAWNAPDRAEDEELFAQLLKDQDNAR